MTWYSTFDYFSNSDSIFSLFSALPNNETCKVPDRNGSTFDCGTRIGTEIVFNRTVGEETLVSEVGAEKLS